MGRKQAAPSYVDMIEKQAREDALRRIANGETKATPKEATRRVLAERAVYLRGVRALTDDAYAETYPTPCRLDHPTIAVRELTARSTGKSEADIEESKKQDLALYQAHKNAFRGEHFSPSYAEWIRCLVEFENLLDGIMRLENQHTADLFRGLTTKEGQRAHRKALTARLTGFDPRTGVTTIPPNITPDDYFRAMAARAVVEIARTNESQAISPIYLKESDPACQDALALQRGVVVRQWSGGAGRPDSTMTAAEKHWARETAVDYAPLRERIAECDPWGNSDSATGLPWRGIATEAALAAQVYILRKLGVEEGRDYWDDFALPAEETRELVYGGYPFGFDKQFREIELSSAIACAQSSIIRLALLRTSLPKGHVIKTHALQLGFDLKRARSEARQFAWRNRYKPVALGGFSAYTVRPDIGPQEDECE